MRKLLAIATILFVLAVGVPIGLNIWYTNSVIRHECTALRDLTAKPVPYPANPAKNPSRVATYNFYIALKQWEHQDGCN